MIAEEAEHTKLLPPEDVSAECPHDKRVTPESPLPFLRDGKVQPRHDPGWGALKQRELAHDRGDLRHELNRAGASAYDRYTLSLQIDSVIPLRRMKGRPGKLLDPRKFWKLRNVQAAHPGDQNSSSYAQVAFSGSGQYIPRALRLVPNRFAQTRVHLNMRRESMVLDAAFQIIVDFLLAGIHPRPVRPELERKGIQMGR